jgi:uncharacterized protein (DUF427 family)
MKPKRIEPKPGQESVWDYPRPPRLEPFSGHIRIIHHDQVILDTNQAFRILETSHPPTYYLPIKDFKEGVLVENRRSSFCEFKGKARYFDLISGDKRAVAAAWLYPNPMDDKYLPIKDHLSVYAHLVDACYVNDEQVQAQEGDFYGGWITSNIVGPFKGGAGTWGW